MDYILLQGNWCSKYMLQLEFNSKPLGECLHWYTHSHTYAQVNKRNASSGPQDGQQRHNNWCQNYLQWKSAFEINKKLAQDSLDGGGRTTSSFKLTRLAFWPRNSSAVVAFFLLATLSLSAVLLARAASRPAMSHANAPPPLTSAAISYTSKCPNNVAKGSIASAHPIFHSPNI